jgi:hypothetical protein
VPSAWAAGVTDRVVSVYYPLADRRAAAAARLPGVWYGVRALRVAAMSLLIVLLPLVLFAAAGLAALPIVVALTTGWWGGACRSFAPSGAAERVAVSSRRLELMGLIPSWCAPGRNSGGG